MFCPVVVVDQFVPDPNLLLDIVTRVVYNAAGYVLNVCTNSKDPSAVDRK
jgi:hypothetical protein